MTHQTDYTYAAPVSVGHNLAFLRPRDLAGQRCLGNLIDFDPVPATTNTRTDYFGNYATHFTVQEPHRHMSVVAVSEVEVDRAAPMLPGTSPPWEQVADGLRRDRSPAGLDALQFVFDSPLAAAQPALTDYARASFPPGRPILDAAYDLTHRVFTDFAYDPTTTTVSTPIDTVFAQRSGVCQDFSHVQIAMLRGLGLSARYVSGYLRTFRDRRDPKLVGADASHAWLAVYDGRGGWIGFDPTNDQVPGEHHVTAAWGRDYADVSPVRGVIVGGGRQQIDVKVDVRPV
ncbi:MAG: transglutaminase family protein [Planctomycetota bacterium]